MIYTEVRTLYLFKIYKCSFVYFTSMKWMYMDIMQYYEQIFYYFHDMTK